MFKYHLTCLVVGLMHLAATSQITLSGIVLDEISHQPVQGVLVKSEWPDQGITDKDGRFTIRHATEDVIRLSFFINGENTDYQTTTDGSLTIDLGQININSAGSRIQDNELPTITLEESDDRQDANISGLLQAGDDIFGRITNFTFSTARFRRRGLDSEYSDGYLNNLPVNDLESGGVFWSNWGGLNDVFRQDQFVLGAGMSEWGYGGIASSFNTDLRASSQWRQKRISYAVTNRNYRNRIMGTWSTGMSPKGWALSLSASRRWAEEGFIEGTFYDGWSYFISVVKKLNERHSLNVVAFGAPYKRGGSSTSIQEMYDLAGDHYYNSFWGYQQGKKRSGRVYSAHQPLFMLRHDFVISEKVNLSTVVGYQTGHNSIIGLDWLDANDPRPDYYRRLPSYIDDPLLAGQVESYLKEDPSRLQIQWDDLYQVNLNSVFSVDNVNGIPGNSLTGRLSRYVMEERRSDLEKKSANVVLEFLPGTNSQVRVGLSAILQDNRTYKVLEDLLGGEFYLDWDKFAAQDFPGNDDALQNDLRRPNRVVYEGDQFGWDYYSRIRQQSAWVSYEVETDRWEFAAAASVKNHTYWRDGQTQNGKFPDNSFGEGEKNQFFLPSGKGLIRYKIDGRNYITLSGMVADNAPTFRNAYVSPRTRDNVVTGLKNESATLGEIRYDLRSPDLKIGVAGYLITTLNGTESTNFYHDDENTFVNFSLTNIDKEYTGIEFAVEGKIRSVRGLSYQGAAAIGQYIYTSRPIATVTQDNDGSVLERNITIFAKNLYVSGTPQSAYTAGLSYRSPKFWTLFLNVNYFQESWINFNPLRRTSRAIDLVEYPSEQWDAILQQEKVDPAWTVDLSFYKSWQVDWPKNRTLYALNIGITNLLNNQDYINGGFEQYRFDYTTKDVNTFPSRYSYMQGLNFFVQASMRM